MFQAPLALAQLLLDRLQLLAALGQADRVARAVALVRELALVRIDLLRERRAQVLLARHRGRSSASSSDLSSPATATGSRGGGGATGGGGSRRTLAGAALLDQARSPVPNPPWLLGVRALGGCVLYLAHYPKSAEMFMIAGPRMTRNIAGKMKSTVGNSILIGAFIAFSSAAA